MEEKNWYVQFDILEDFMTEIFKSIGVPEVDATVCADVLITSDKRGIESHGIGRMKTIYYDRIRKGIQQAQTQFEIVKETPTTAVIDGHDGMGHVISKRAMQMAIDKAKVHGLGMTTVRNSTHYGICGYYLLMAAQAGMIGITGTNARPSIAPTFGVENMLGTNPLTFGCPTDEEFPFIIDAATSVSQRGKIEVYSRSEKDIPEGWVIDKSGKYRTDTEQILKDLVKGTAALVPLGGMGEETGGHKGYGYATFVEIISSALCEGHYLKQLLGFENGKPVPYGLGHFFMAINIENFVHLGVFKGIAGTILRQLRASEKAPGNDRIYTAGEKEHLIYLERLKTGVPINENLAKEINTMRSECGLERFSFPWD
ncbi:Ldh family oxidoreductase [Myxococcota bacterium]|nr:Ldh family oxidoreductase [Myxococcota bacterium]MBU1381821.1 Ldh family oxidoreductase [Myxococcota bacterium]MBU1498598.1 Ldh family oxidoreductase [Myxococcota bacterium]